MPEDDKIGTNDVRDEQPEAEAPAAPEAPKDAPKAEDPAANLAPTKAEDSAPTAEEYDAAIAEVNKEIADARAAIDEERQAIDEAEVRLAQLLDEKARVHPPLDPSVNIKQYLESQAAARAARFEGAQMAAQVLGIRRPSDLAKSPIDRRLSSENRAKRRATSLDVFRQDAR